MLSLRADFPKPDTGSRNATTVDTKKENTSSLIMMKRTRSARRDSLGGRLVLRSLVEEFLPVLATYLRGRFEANLAESDLPPFVLHFHFC